MVAYRRLTAAEKTTIALSAKCGVPISRIAESLKHDQGTIRYWIRRDFHETIGKPTKTVGKRGIRRPKPPPKPPKRALQAQKHRRQIVRRLACETVANKHRIRPRYTGAPAIRAVLIKMHGIFASTQTIRNDLRAMGFNFRTRTKSMAYTAADYANRADFARRMSRRGKRCLVFTDEKTFTCGDYSYNRQWVAPGGNSIPLDRSNTAQDTVYVWAAIGYGFRKLVIIRKTTQAEKQRRSVNGEGKPNRFDSASYIRRCLAGAVIDYCHRNGRTLQADNHRVHYSERVRKYVTGKGVKITEDWPARSPDLNPIENFWAYLQERVSHRVPLTASELEEAIKAEFDAVPTRVIDQYVESFQAKCELVASRDGRM